MLPDNGTQYCPHMAHLCEFAACGFQHIMHAAVVMQAETDSLPDDMKQYAEVLTNSSMGVLSASYVEHMRLIAELDLRDIARLALPFEQQTEQDSVQRSGRDEI